PPMADMISNLPRAEQGDASEVALALETARALWSQGHGLESVRWIQRAAEQAESAGNDLRAVSLARAAADLRAEVGMASEPAAPLQAAPTLIHEDDFSEKTIVDSPATLGVRRSLQSGVQIGEIIPAPASSQVMATPLPLAPVVGPSPVAEHQAVRVAVLSQNHATREVTLRMLGDNELAPGGSTEALLVSLDPQRKLLG
ncbi:MAG TPA: hypothetical protein VIW29_22030, partial [Polyangiaceae bacterium]